MEPAAWLPVPTTSGHSNSQSPAHPATPGKMVFWSGAAAAELKDLGPGVGTPLTLSVTSFPAHEFHLYS